MGTRRLTTLVTTNWLKSCIGQNSGTGLRVLDASWLPKKDFTGYEDFYKKGHLPSALHFDHSRCVQGTPSIPWNLPDTNCFTEYVQGLGVGSKTHVVAYDSLNTRAAARAWWIFRIFGHKSVSILDGGMKKWMEDGFETTTDEPVDVEKSDFKASLDKNLLWDFDTMKANLDTKNYQVMDARSPTEFSGEEKTGFKPGHIPGAKNIPFESLFTEQGVFKSTDDLHRLFESAGVDIGRPMVSMCLTGLTACSIAAAASLLGRSDVPVYYGSWKDWSSQASDELCAMGKS